jgi:hypothetical protein
LRVPGFDGSVKAIELLDSSELARASGENATAAARRRMWRVMVFMVSC